MTVKTQADEGSSIACARRRLQSAVKRQNFNATFPSLLLPVHSKEPEPESFTCALLPLLPRPGLSSGKREGAKELKTISAMILNLPARPWDVWAFALLVWLKHVDALSLFLPQWPRRKVIGQELSRAKCWSSEATSIHPWCCVMLHKISFFAYAQGDKRGCAPTVVGDESCTRVAVALIIES